MPSADKSDNCSKCKHSARALAHVDIPGAKWLALPFSFCTCSSLQPLGAGLLWFQVPQTSTTVLPLVTVRFCCTDFRLSPNLLCTLALWPSGPLKTRANTWVPKYGPVRISSLVPSGHCLPWLHEAEMP